jgi:hypothetical protein
MQYMAEASAIASYNPRIQWDEHLSASRSDPSPTAV